MKSNINYIIIVILFCSSILSCRKNAITTNNTEEQKTNKLVIKDEFIDSNPGIYLDYYAQTDFKVNIISFKENPLENEVITLSQTASQTSTKAELPFNVKINNIPIIKNVKTKALSEEKFLSSLFGNNTSFTISSLLTKSDVKDTTINIRLPELIEITSPKIRSDNDLYPLCYYKNLIIRWNADLGNEHGVLVVVEWYGNVVYGNDFAVNFRKSLVCPDTGEYTFNESIFEEIPNGALIFITLLRGNIQNLVYDEYSYKLYSSTIVKLPLILIRNLKFRE